MLRKFFGEYETNSVLSNGFLGFANDQFRCKSKAEISLKMIANGHPIGRFVDGVANGVELGAHLTRVNTDAYYKNNARNINDDFERRWDAFKRATDIDYS